MAEAKKIFMTGASGFLGNHLLRDFTKQGFELYALVRDKEKMEKLMRLPGVNVLEGTIDAIAKFSKEVSLCNGFVHIAGEKRDEAKMRYVNVDSLRMILQEVIKHPHLDFMLMSSAGVYGIRKNPSRVLDEGVKCHPDNLYEQTKLEAEKLLEEFAKAYPLHYVILRPTNIFGEYDPGRKLLNLMKALQRGKIFLLNPRAVSNYVYAGLVSETAIQIITSGKFTNEIYNVNSPLPLEDFISILKQEIGLNSKTRYMPRGLARLSAILGNLLPSRFQFFNSAKYFELTNEKIISAEKLEKIISVNDKQMLSDGLKKLVAHYKHNHWL